MLNDVPVVLSNIRPITTLPFGCSEDDDTETCLNNLKSGIKCFETKDEGEICIDMGNQQFPNQQFPNQQFPNQQFPNLGGGLIQYPYLGGVLSCLGNNPTGLLFCDSNADLIPDVQCVQGPYGPTQCSPIGQNNYFGFGMN